MPFPSVAVIRCHPGLLGDAFVLVSLSKVMRPMSRSWFRRLLRLTRLDLPLFSHRRVSGSPKRQLYSKSIGPSCGRRRQDQRHRDSRLEATEHGGQQKVLSKNSVKREQQLKKQRIGAAPSPGLQLSRTASSIARLSVQASAFHKCLKPRAP